MKTYEQLERDALAYADGHPTGEITADDLRRAYLAGCSAGVALTADAFGEVHDKSHRAALDAYNKARRP